MNIAGVARLLVCVVLVGFLSAGCQRVKTEQQVKTLDESHKTYGKMLRWKEYEQAVRYIVPREGPAKSLDLESLDDVRITSYEVVDKLIVQDENEAVITVKIEFYVEDTGKVHSLRDEQNWWYEPEAERWFLDDSLPDFEAAMRAGRRR
jgi:hypothetical protein